MRNLAKPVQSRPFSVPGARFPGPVMPFSGLKTLCYASLRRAGGVGFGAGGVSESVAGRFVGFTGRTANCAIRTYGGKERPYLNRYSYAFILFSPTFFSTYSLTMAASPDDTIFRIAGSLANRALTASSLNRAYKKSRNPHRRHGVDGAISSSISNLAKGYGSPHWAQCCVTSVLLILYFLLMLPERSRSPLSSRGLR